MSIDRFGHDALAFESNSPGVFTDVVLKRTSSFVFTEGVKPFGVCACAMAHDANAATTIEEVIYILKGYVPYEAMYNRNSRIYLIDQRCD